MVHDKTGPDRKKLDRRNVRQQPIKFKDSGFRTGKMLKKKINKYIFYLLGDWPKLFKLPIYPGSEFLRSAIKGT